MDPPISLVISSIYIQTITSHPLVFAYAEIGFKGKKSTFTTGAMHSDVSGVIVSGHGVRISTPYNDTLLYKQKVNQKYFNMDTI